MRIVAMLLTISALLQSEDSTWILERGTQTEDVTFVKRRLSLRTPYGRLVVPAAAVRRLVYDGQKQVTLTTWTDRLHGRLEHPLDLAIAFRVTTIALTDTKLRITARRGRRPRSDEKHRFLRIRGGMRVLLRGTDNVVTLHTKYGELQFGMRDVESLTRTKDGVRIRTSKSEWIGKLDAASVQVRTAYGALAVPAQAIVGIDSGPTLRPGAVIDDQYLVVATKTVGERRYAVVKRDDGMTWNEAAALARKIDGHLATIRNRQELDVLLALAQTHSRTAWIGLSDAGVEGKWHWHSGAEDTFRHWHPGEPNNVGAQGEDFAEMYLQGLRAGTWNDTEVTRRIETCIIELRH